MRPASMDKESTGFFDIGGDGEFQTLILGGNGCNEHERGVEALQREFGVNHNAKPGIERYRVTDAKMHVGLFNFGTKDIPQIAMIAHKSIQYFIPEDAAIEQDNDNPYFFECSKINQDYLFKTVGNHCFYNDPVKGHSIIKPRSTKAQKMLWAEQNAGIFAAWDAKEFAVLAIGSEACNNLHEIYKAFKAKTITISTSKANNPFAQPGLALTLIERLTPEIINKIRDNDRINDAINKFYKPIDGLIPEKFKRDKCISSAVEIRHIIPSLTDESISKIKNDENYIPKEDDLTIRLYIKHSDHRYIDLNAEQMLSVLIDDVNPLSFIPSENTETPAM